MKKQITNPFLPSDEYLPDPEPRVFDGRVYVYGSHDKFNGISFCLNDYISYSAPVDDLTDWRYEGVIFRKSEDPNHGIGPINSLFAPDVIKGLDGKYYMYYFIGYVGIIGVAICDKPAGEYKHLGYVKHPDGTILGSHKKDHFQFDPGIFIDDDERIYLYSGFAPKKSFRFMMKNKNIATEGAMVMELERDMMTLKSDYKFIAKTMYNDKDTDFEGHGFFEAASMRKFHGKYYFIYSSYLNHELCYAYSDYPDRDFKYGGTLVSIADIGLSDKPINFMGNTHGSILNIEDDYYIFYHRQTNRHSFSRQTCAEKLSFDGLHFKQSEVTSQGLNKKPLIAKGVYQAAIACNLYSSKGVTFYSTMKRRSKYYPYFTQDTKDGMNHPSQYIKNFSKYATAGYKYFMMEDLREIGIKIKGRFKGNVYIYTNLEEEPVASITIVKTKSKVWFITKIDKPINGKHAIYLKASGKGFFNIYQLRFN